MTRHRPSAWPTILGAFALFGIVFQLILFQLSPGSGGTLIGGLTGDDALGDDGAGPVKSISAVPAHSQTPAPVITSTS
jgi:hypothetical protein